ncbi:periplasmic nitrate reductase [Histoplasma capsulatum var. duboisii H88]|uniref:Periplasmic nitrate reductase n=1 Tax=Ajellomyces capsulatus (strain H88) TaxID=544711 RepID=A0A8A1LNE5_AJEC8|nr:periplasmic nitrate reductase [Histoplasma capsulatum var. duboisii H88]
MEQILLLLNGPQQLQFGNDWIDEEFVSNHVVGIVALRKVVDKYTPEYVEKITGVPKAQLQETVEIVGMTPPLPYTTLQGVYQSSSTARTCQINTLSLPREKIGKPGGEILQVNGQLTG